MIELTLMDIMRLQREIRNNFELRSLCINKEYMIAILVTPYNYETQEMV